MEQEKKNREAWSGPYVNENWESEYQKACAWFASTGMRPTCTELPYRVAKRRWTLDTEQGQLRVDLVLFGESPADPHRWSYRGVFEDGDTLDNYDTLDDAMDAMERVKSDQGVQP